MSELALGVDVGTTSTKAVLVDRDGVVVASASARHGLRKGPGVVEADPEQWWRSTRTAIGKLDPDQRSRTAVVGVSGNMSSLVVMDEDGRAVRPAILLADTRGEAEIAALPPAVRARIEDSGHNVPGTVFTLAKLLWLARNEPATLTAAATFGAAKDFVRARLTGVLGSEPTDAYNTLLLDRGGMTWHTELIRECGLDSAPFPALSESDALVGGVSVSAAADTGLPEGVPVQAGLGDMAAAMLGAGDTEQDGSVLVSLGTSITALVRLPDQEFDPAWRGRLTYHPLPGGAFALASLITGGLAINWLRSLAGEQVLREAPDEPDPDSPLVFLPHLAGAGTPEFLPAARGSVFGIEPGTSGPELARALFEGTAFELAMAVRLAGGRRVLLSGGGTHLPVWVRVITDVLDLPARVVDEPEVSATGAARLAWRALGVRCPAPTGYRELRPRPEFRAAWRARSARYARAREAAFAHYLKESADEQKEGSLDSHGHR
ncbi:xylulokinase [Actinophytocola gossypii]|uniref:Xylulokinase n=1 Tax=Actinophytocola gossypii TaxID=2812003 RepID=A0ABT2J364_9PSEU|nr:FGGY family carbohydrate kinase [Actinophytocola gossypii]MCT2582292.1 hypothetical protein [Actinophytocola gossypii]